MGLGSRSSMDEWLAFFEDTEGPLAYLALGASALVEYVFPPFPGDMATLVAVFLAATAGYRWWLVHLVLTFGSTVGGTLVWGFGRWLKKHEDRWPRFLKGEKTKRALDRLTQRFEKRGPWYLALNRFIPAFRALFFVAAGLAGMRLRAVLFFGALSAAAWNGILLAVGFSVGSNIERLEQLYRQYTVVALSVVGVFVVGAAGVALWRRRSSE